jgi:hypothetical protein
MHDTDIGTTRSDWTSDAEISDGDEQRYDAGVRACAKHLADLVRVHGPHPEPRPKGRRKGKAGYPACEPSQAGNVTKLFRARK